MQWYKNSSVAHAVPTSRVVSANKQARMKTRNINEVKQLIYLRGSDPMGSD